MSNAARHWLGRILVFAITFQVPVAFALACADEDARATAAAMPADCHDDEAMHAPPAEASADHADHTCCDGECACSAAVPVIASEANEAMDPTLGVRLAAAAHAWHTRPSGLVTPPPIQ